MTYLFNSVSHSQKTVIYEQRRLPIAQGRRNALAFCLRQHHSAEALIYDVVVVESACILRQAINSAAERTPRPAVNRMAVGGTDDVWTSGVDGGMDHICRGVEEAVLATVYDFAGVVD